MKVDLKNLKGRERRRVLTVLCLVVGMLVLTTSVYANLDDARGYSNYKESLKQLAFEADNFEATAEMNMTVDGESVQTVYGEMKKADDDYSFYTKSTGADLLSGSNETERYEYQSGRDRYVFYPENNKYMYRNDVEPVGVIMPLEDESEKKAVHFMELLADTMVGDLKNNVILTSNENGIKEYSISVSRNQIPEVVRAGISLMFTASNDSYDNSEYGSVTFEEYQETFKNYYEKETGKEFNDSYFYSAYDSMTEEEQNEYHEMDSDMWDKYDDIMEEKGDKGILYVKTDGSYEYFNNTKEYEETTGKISLTNVTSKFGNDPYIENASMKVTLDEQGRLLKNDVEVKLTGVDEQGKEHTAVVTIKASISEYGTAKPDVFNAEGKELMK